MKKLYLLRITSYMAYVFFALGLPIILLAHEYELFGRDEPSKVSIRVMGLIVVFVIMFFFKKEIKELVHRLPDCKLRTFLLKSAGVTPYAILYLALTYMQPHIYNLRYITLYSLYSYLISILFAMMNTHYRTTIEQMKKKK